MRKAYIGLSTPIGFDYRNKASKGRADLSSSPNPVLDSPFGIMLLFDEVIFLTRSLCPENMRNLPYVSFLDESDRIPQFSQFEAISIRNNAYEHYRSSPSIAGASFNEILAQAGVSEEMNVDNHSHGLKIGEFSGQANADFGNLALDRFIVERLNDRSIEMVTNTYFERILQPAQPISGQAQLTELLVLEGIPNYLTIEGPYHPVIDEVRNDKYIVEFRKWISNQTGLASAAEVNEAKKEVENSIKTAQEKLFLRYLDSNRHYTSIAKAVIGDVAGVLLPGASTVAAIAETGIEKINPIAQRWQGFVVSSQQSVRNTNLLPRRQ